MKTNDVKTKAAIKREQNDACINSVEREQARILFGCKITKKSLHSLIFLQILLQRDKRRLELKYSPFKKLRL